MRRPSEERETLLAKALRSAARSASATRLLPTTLTCGASPVVTAASASIATTLAAGGVAAKVGSFGVPTICVAHAPPTGQSYARARSREEAFCERASRGVWGGRRAPSRVARSCRRR